MANKTDRERGQYVQIYIPSPEELAAQQEEAAREERPGFLRTLITVPNIILAILAGAVMMFWAGPEVMLIALSIGLVVLIAAFATWATGTQYGATPYVVGAMVLLAALALDIEERIFANAMLYGSALQKVSQPVVVIGGILLFLVLFKRR